MERLTYFDGGKWRLKIGDTEYSGEAVDRLAAYEDTGLEPEDFKSAFTEDALLKLIGQLLGVAPDRLRELAQADREGRWIAEENESISKRNRLIKHKTYSCSICGRSNGRAMKKYCPNCGALMVGT